ncbi:MAG: hydroxymethylbilane synthase [Gammaproteobacteria bacterium]|nr:hydroxymethylbilane synthase [Gammaproteobacteria bacterium]NND37668.1 hydroxymethylbilane synthase [Gammaproteobacteria bacterium]
MGRTLRLGTRASLLAVAQSQIVKQALGERCPTLRVELVTMDTRGDRDRATPLAEVNDPDFFSAELDRALLDGRVDFTVHSMKDLDATRPDNIARAAIPLRENPRDVIVFRGDIVDRLRSGETIRLGSSSPRRQHNVARFLNDCLPILGPQPNLRVLPLRGPVHDRVARIAEHPTGADALDGVVLALAGLERLWRDPDGHRALAPHLAGARWMVLPLSACPTAPAQGALAIECRADDRATLEILAGLHDAQTADLVQMELDAMGALPQSEQMGVGATAVYHATLGGLLYRRGARDESCVITWQSPAAPPDRDLVNAWDGGAWQSGIERRPLPCAIDLENQPAIFVAHWFAAPAQLTDRAGTRIWVSGTKSWRKLAERGIWVEGCADNLGFTNIVPTLASDVLNLPELGRWTALTRRGAEAGWHDTHVGYIVPTYELSGPHAKQLENARRAVSISTDFFWGSVEQFRAVEAWLPDNARHACGAGKTADALRAAGVEAPLVFPSRGEWQAWLR